MALEKEERAFQLFSKEKVEVSIKLVFISVFMVFLIGRGELERIESISNGSGLVCSSVGGPPFKFRLISIGLAKEFWVMSLFPKLLVGLGVGMLV